METISAAWMVLSLALVFSILLTPFSMHLARRVGAVDVPCSRSVHVVAVPRLGGIGIFLSMACAVAFYLKVDAFSFGFLAGLLVIVLTGLLDDIRPLSHRFKFAGEILASVAFIGISGSELSGVGNLFGFGELVFGPFAFVATVFCMVGLINAMNLSDGLDGLAGGLAIIAALFFAFFAYKAGQPNVMMIALALSGALLGFLLYNGFPARLFMGDVGSLMIGYTCAVLAVQMVNVSVDHFSVQPITIALILAVPLLDTLVVMGARIVKGISPFKPDKTHLHHRLMALGLNQNQAVSIMYVLMFLYGALALLAFHAPAYWQFYTAIIVTALLYGLLGWLGRKQMSLAVGVIAPLARGLLRIESMLLVSLFDVSQHYSRFISRSLALLALLPLFFLDSKVDGLVLVAIMALTLVLLARRHNPRVRAIWQGILYLLILFLLYVCHTALQQSFWATYWSVLVSLSTGWIVLTLLVSHTRRMLALHSFEILLILISWLFFFLIMPMVDFAPLSGEDIRVICVYAIPLLLVGKLCLGGARVGAWGCPT
ncbi:undecaprenyl/decaprenyl-phosphate alpha-N-acetylglucosaminyl 1-phosphate transferase [Mariprofundus erugo]|uniref:glycosyltransferase family 4 protein n=1 Tax=Mariprofundus erugo TaxID=2528639 RepID=UPI0010FCE58A|nr:MraY family glycosyltransferase [Mariprofundus erugo]TLS78391.1 undecaprenyl/decaprenyl-phosphate alpha-N-acetylglucosaminyl 1-phosphate transferase [Mariprofundus erugo]